MSRTLSGSKHNTVAEMSGNKKIFSPGRQISLSAVTKMQG
jgi:hypothetical protein